MMADIAAIMTGLSEVTHVTVPESFATVRFSTADLPQNMRVATWREHYGHTVLRADIAPADDASFDAAVVSRTLPGLQLVSGRFTAARIIRTREMIADGNDDLSLLVNQTGNVTVHARGREVTLRENDAVLISSGEAVVFDRRSFGESIAIRLPQSMLSAVVVDIDDAIMHHIPRDTAALKLLTSYSNTLLGGDHVVETPALRRHVATHVLDLVALTSLNEGTPLSLIEAMANQRPVIATAVGGVVDLLGLKLSSADGYFVCERGVLVEGQDPETFARGLARLIEDDALRREIATRGREFVQQNYSKDRLLRDVARLYAELVSEARP
jgi:hypothetical protein